MSVLDAMLYVRENLDGTLAVNYSCRKQRCGSCAVKINGKVGLACYTPIKKEQKIEPLPGFNVLKDLIVDWSPYERRLYELQPDPSPISPKQQDHMTSEREKSLADEAFTCIRCFSCVGACPTVDVTSPSGFAGPAIATMLATHLDLEQSKQLADSVLKARLEYCTRCFACNSVCPAGIDIVACISELQDMAATTNEKGKYVRQMVKGYV